MAITTLSNLSVPLASDQSSSSQGLLMPKLAYRFRVLFHNFGVSTPTTELTKQVANAGRPSVNFEDINIPVYNSTVKLQGKHSWDDLTVSLRDDATGVVSKLIGEQLQKQFDFYEQASANAGGDYKFSMTLETLDGGNGAYTPVVLESWELYGCYVKSAKYSELGYDKNEAMTIELSIRFDNALQSPTGTGVGTAVGRGLSTVAI